MTGHSLGASGALELVAMFRGMSRDLRRRLSAIWARIRLVTSITCQTKRGQ